MKVWEPGAPKSDSGRRWLSQVKKREKIPLPVYLCRPSTVWIMPAHISEGGSSLFSLLIQILISSRNTLTDTPRNNVLPASWAYFGTVKMTHKINHHPWWLKHIKWQCNSISNVIDKSHKTVLVIKNHQFFDAKDFLSKTGLWDSAWRHWLWSQAAWDWIPASPLQWLCKTLYDFIFLSCFSFLISKVRIMIGSISWLAARIN